jgi:superfamily II DNA or RNA helicase
LGSSEAIPSLFGYPADIWQCKVLECCPPLSRQPQSALVCAPTSAGKTFLAREIMRRFVCWKPEGLVVYLCPTTALAAMVFRDLTENLHIKEEGMKDKKPVVGLFTRDLRVRESDSSTKILVVISELLEVLVLGTTGDKIRGRITCLIIDEAHYLGVSKRGSVLERFFSMIEAPFYAFSATLEAANNFIDWIRPVKPNVRLIPDVEQGDNKITRSTDLAYYYYDSTTKSSKRGQKKASKKAVSLVDEENPGKTSQNCFVPLHPFSLLETENDIREKLRLFPDLLPHQLIETIDLLGPEGRRSVRRVLLEKIESSEADNFDDSEFGLFSLLCKCNGVTSFPFLRRHVGMLDSTLRECVLQLVSEERNLLASVQKVQPQHLRKSGFSEHFLSAMQRSNRGRFDGIQREIDFRSRFKVIDFENVEQFSSHVLTVILELERRNMIPAMCFFFTVNDLVSIVMKLLESTAEMCVDDYHEQLEAQIEIFMRFDNRAKIERDATVEMYETVLKCLKRGWGIHFGALPVSIRSLMEELFAAGALKVIFCTTTLATGVHTPCKSVILVRDHATFLNAVEFHQIVGRAGRRNNDSVGHVILMFLNLPRARELICTRFTEIYGEMDVSFSFLLRCVAAIQGMDPEESYALQRKSFKAFESMLRRPFYLHVIGAEKDVWNGVDDSVAIVKRESVDTDYLHYLNLIHLSLISLQRLCLVDDSFNPIDLYMIVSRIHYIEPFNIALVSSIISQSIPLGFAQFGHLRPEKGFVVQKRKRNLPNQPKKTISALNNNTESISSTFNTFQGLEVESGKPKSKKKPNNSKKLNSKAPVSSKKKNVSGSDLKRINANDTTSMDVSHTDELVESDFLTASTMLRSLVDYVGSKVYSVRRTQEISDRSCYSEAQKLLNEKKYRELRSLLTDVPVGYLLPLPEMMTTNLSKYNLFILNVAKEFTMSCAEPIPRDSEKLMQKVLALSHVRFRQPCAIQKTLLFASQSQTSKKKSLISSESSYVARCEDKQEMTVFSLPAAFGPTRAVCIGPLSEENKNLDLYFLSLNHNHMMGNLPLVDMKNLKNKVFCTILTDLINHPSLVAKDAEFLFEQDELYHKRQLEESWDLMRKVEAAVRLLLKKIADNDKSNLHDGSSKQNDSANVSTTTASSTTQSTSNNSVNSNTLPSDNRIPMTEYLELLADSMKNLFSAYRLNKLYSTPPLLGLQQFSWFITDRDITTPTDGAVQGKQSGKKSKNRVKMEEEFVDDEDESHTMNYDRLEKIAKSATTKPQSFLKKLQFFKKELSEERNSWPIDFFFFKNLS